MKMNQFKLITLLLLFSPLTLMAQPNYPPPSGVYCSCGPTTGMGYGSVNPKVAEKDFVQGILVRIGWDLCEPSEDSYDWSLIEGQITAAKQYGKKISLAFVNGKFVPKWVFDKGAESMQVLIPNTKDTIAVPWDSVHLKHWLDFIDEAGAHFRSDTTIQLVYITNASTNGCEMQLPFSGTPSLNDLNYSDQKLIDSWKQVVSAFANAFPNHYLSNDYHPVNGSDVVADSVYSFAVSSIGSRYGANAWWWTQRNTTVYPAQYQILLNSVSSNPFTGVQFANSGTQDSAAFGEGGMPEAMAKAIRDKICYWEIWNEDILNPEFESTLESAHCIKTGINPFPVYQLDIYPNPSRGKIKINSNDLSSGSTINIYSANGAFIKQFRTSRNETLELDLSGLQGFYVLELINDSKVYRQKILIQD